ncbi:hypothetical protein LSAT2_017555, partial [Lamellibrachia satsuma]
AFVPANTQSGFRVSGVFPFNKDAFDEDEFLAAIATDQPAPDESEPPRPGPHQQTTPPPGPRQQTTPPPGPRQQKTPPPGPQKRQRSNSSLKT